MLARLKFDTSTLAGEILDRLPESIWSNPSVRFFDPSIAGGQFMRQIEDRLRAYGVSDDDIRRRVHGIDNNRMRVQFAVSKMDLRGTYWAGNMQDVVEKYDVIVSAPPFKNGGEKGGKSSLWRRYVKSCWSLVSESGYISMVTPTVPIQSKDLGSLFTQHRCLWIMTDTKRHFPSVGSNFSAWCLQKAPADGKTLLLPSGEEQDIRDGKISKNLAYKKLLQKLLSNKKMFEPISNRAAYHTDISKADTGQALSTAPDQRYIYRLRRTSGDKEYVWCDKKPDDYESVKVVFTFSGYPYYRVHTSSDPCGSIAFQSGHIAVQDEQQAHSLIAIYQSTLYRFMQNQLSSSGGMRGLKVYTLPRLDLSKTWTDSDMFSYFELDQKEIEIVRANS